MGNNDEATTPKKRFVVKSSAMEEATTEQVVFCSPTLKRGTSRIFSSPRGKVQVQELVADPEANKRGTAGFWIARMCLTAILSGDACGNAHRHSNDMLKGEKLDATSRRRLMQHLALREKCMKLWPGTIDTLAYEDVAAVVDDLGKVLQEFPVVTNMALLKYAAKTHWNSLEEAAITEASAVLHFNALLDAFAPWAISGDESTFKFTAPQLPAVGLADDSIADAICFELVGHVAKYVGDCSEQMQVLTKVFCEQLLKKWVLAEDAEIGREATRVYNECRRFCKVLLFLRDPQLREHTEAAVLKDCKAIDDATLDTSGVASPFSIIGLALHDGGRDKEAPPGICEI